MLRKNGIARPLLLIVLIAGVAWMPPLLRLESLPGTSHVSISVHNYDGRAGAVIGVTYVRDGMTVHEVVTHPTGLTVDEGTVVRLVAIPGPGMSFDKWSGRNIGACDGSSSPSCTLTAGGGGALVIPSFLYDLNVEIEDTNGWSLTRCTVHVRASPSGLSEGDYGPGTIRVSVPISQTIDLTPNPCPGYRFDHWEGGCSGPTCILTNFRPTWSLDLPTTVRAVYKGVRSLEVEVEGAGTTVPPPGVHYYGTGQVVRLVARSYAGYRFDHWVVDGVPTTDQASTAVTMTEDHRVRAVFSPVEAVSTVASLPVSSPSPRNGTSCTSLPADFPLGLRYRGAYAALVVNQDLLARLAGPAGPESAEGVITIGRNRGNWRTYGIEWKGRSVVVRGMEFKAVDWERDYAVILVDCPRANLMLAGAGPLGSRVGLTWLLDRPETLAGRWIVVIQWQDGDGDGSIDPWELRPVFWA